MGICHCRTYHTLASRPDNSILFNNRSFGGGEECDHRHRIFSSGLLGVNRGLITLSLAADLHIFSDNPLDKIFMVAQILVFGWRGLVRVDLDLNLSRRRLERLSAYVVVDASGLHVSALVIAA